MTLTFGGDIAWPYTNCVDIQDVITAMKNRRLVLNLEGALLPGSPFSHKINNQYKFNIYSHENLVSQLLKLNTIAVGLSNNHINDYVGGGEQTVKSIKKNGILYFGINSSPYIDITVDDQDWRLIAAASPLTELSKGKGALSVSRFCPVSLLSEICKYRTKYPNLKIVVFLHWGYELANYPLPADREWAHKAVKMGADAVIGHHPHVIQGIERVGSGIIAYSLGNFIMPQVQYRDHKLVYANDKVLNQMILTLGDNPVVTWFKYDRKDSKITIENEEMLNDSDKISTLTPFSGLDNKSYLTWYKKRRISFFKSPKRYEPVLHSYFGASYLNVHGSYVFLMFKRFVRKALISANLHTPYNWQ